MSDKTGDVGESVPPEALLLQMAGGIPGIVWSTDSDLRFNSCWGACLADLDLRPDQVVGTSLFEFFETDDPQFEAIAAHLRALEGETVAWELQRQGRTYHARVAPLYGDGGRIVGCTGIAQDVTEQRRLEEALRQTQDRYRLAIAEGRAGVWEHDLERHKVYVHPSLRALLGYTEGDFDEDVAAFYGIVHPEDRARLAAEVQAHLEGRTPGIEIEFRVCHKDGGIRWVVTRGSQLFDGNGNPFRILGTVVDVTDLKEAKSSLEESEAKYRALVEQSLQGVFLVQDFRVVFSNPAFAQMLGYTVEELTSLPPDQVQAIVHPEDRALVWGRCEARLDGQPVPPRYEYRIIRKDEIDGWLEISAHRVWYRGRPAVQGAVVDITERKRAEQALRRAHDELEERVALRTAELDAANQQLRLEIAERERTAQQLRLLSSAVAQSKEGVAVIDLDGRLLFINEAFAAMHGYSPEELIGKHVSLLHVPEQMDAVDATLQQTLEKGDFHGEVWHARRDGTVFPAMTHNSVFHDEAGKLIGMIGTMRDITDRKRAEDALRESEKRRAEAEKLAATGRLAARVAHEINNPLAGITNCFRLVKTAVPPDHRHYKFTEIIEKEIDRISRIVRQMFQVHRPYQETVRDVRVADTIGEVVAILEPDCRERRVRVEARTDPVEMTIEVPEGSLRQILYNLLANAIEASPTDGLVTVTATAAEAGHAVQITVTDQGDGIPEAAQDHVFEPFFTTKEDHFAGGLGLGLSISKGIVDSLRGSLDFQTTPGGGTTFLLVLPSAVI